MLRICEKVCILTINADDFGLSDGVVAGILESMERGPVHSTSAMVCNPDDRRRVSAAAGFAPGRVGMHLQLTEGRPVSPLARVPSLVDARGRFPDDPNSTGRLDSADVLVEWRAQLNCLRDLGVEPSHLDSHHHVHTLPGALEAYLELAGETGLPARGCRPLIVRRLQRVGRCRAELCETQWSGGKCTLESLIEALERLLSRTSGSTNIELVCHPAHLDDGLRARSKYVESRRRELVTLCDPDLGRRLRAIGVRLAKPEELTLGQPPS
jgi:predicted glycoside hydrolase/deacetylase ChbG (UPF0249 family)